MYYADQEAARQLGAEDDGSWDMKRKAFEEARARLPNEDPVILILNGDESAHDDTTDIPRGDDGASNQRDSGRVADGMRQYENTGYNYQGNDYSDFSVLNGFDPDICCIKQGNINHPAKVNFVYPSRKWSCIKSRPAKRRIPDRHGDPMERNTQQTIPGLLKTRLSIKISLRFFVKSSIRLSIITIRLWSECKATLLQ